MKKNRGNLLWILLFVVHMPLFGAEGFSWQMKVSTRTPYIKEAVIVTMDARQEEKKGVIRFEFHPQKSSAYEILFLGEEDLRGADDLTHVRFKYALFPLHEGNLSVDFHFVAKRASKEELKEVAIGARNVLRVVKTTDTPVDLNPLLLRARKVPQGTALIGDYTLSCDAPAKEVAPFSQVNLTCMLKGYGYPPGLKTILPGIEGVESFAEVEKFDDKLFHKRTYRYALLAEKSFTIPKISIKAFDPAKEKPYILESPAQEISVMHAEPKEILDSRDSLPKEVDFAKYRSWLYGVLLFLAGFLSAKLLPDFTNFTKKFAGSHLAAENRFLQKVEKTDDMRLLMKYLLLEDRELFAKEIASLEEALYQKRNLSLKSLKSQIRRKVADGS